MHTCTRTHTHTHTHTGKRHRQEHGTYHRLAPTELTLEPLAAEIRRGDARDVAALRLQGGQGNRIPGARGSLFSRVDAAQHEAADEYGVHTPKECAARHGPHRVCVPSSDPGLPQRLFRRWREPPALASSPSHTELRRAGTRAGAQTRRGRTALCSAPPPTTRPPALTDRHGHADDKSFQGRDHFIHHRSRWSGAGPGTTDNRDMIKS